MPGRKRVPEKDCPEAVVEETCEEVTETTIDESKVFCAECGCPHSIDGKCVSCRAEFVV